jgi:hypothetical protein
MMLALGCAAAVAAPVAPPAQVLAMPDFPAALRHRAPLTDLNDAAVFTMNEGAGSDYGALLQRKVGSDMLIRNWFKWHNSPDFSKLSNDAAFSHQLGELLGGGITCSALYDGENGITNTQLLDMATRGPDGSLLNAWDHAGIRHGSLSSPAYLDYLFHWCKVQIDAGADCLFMDENNAAISGAEGYDDHSLADFREYLLADCPQTHGWALNDPRWKTVFGVDIGNPKICPSGKMDTFDYRGYMRVLGIFARPETEANKLYSLWSSFRPWRDDRSWHSLVNRIHAYGRSINRHIFVDANGLVKYVDLQVLNDWNQWKVTNGHIDLSDNDMATWHGEVFSGQSLARRHVPVVIFHDWGFSNPPFPWMASPPSEQIVWMRTRAAEIYAAGGFFAFPVHGPFNCDAGAQGTLPTIAHLTEFYQRHKDIYVHSRWVGCETLTSNVPLTSLSATWMPETKTVIVHAINRNVADGVLNPRGPVDITIQLATAPNSAVAISPDFDGQKKIAYRIINGMLHVTLPSLDAYTVVLLNYSRQPDLTGLRGKTRVYTISSWSRPMRTAFRVSADGMVEDSTDLGTFVQGMLHSEMRNPPIFSVDAGKNASVEVHVQAVAIGGARLQFSLDGKPVRTIDLPDRDGKNDSGAPEYDAVYSCPIPAGRHHVTIDNIGGDWATVTWYAFNGMAGDGL